MILEAVYEQGVLRLTQPLNLPEGTRVEITLIKSGTNFQQKKNRRYFGSDRFTTSRGRTEWIFR